MNNGCPKCEKIGKSGKYNPSGLCLDCQLGQAEADKLKAMNRVEEIKQKIVKDEITPETHPEKYLGINGIL